MADEEVARSIEEVLNKIVNTTDQSGNMRKELKKTIYENVNTLRNLFVKMQATLKEGTRQKEQTDRETQAMKAELDACRASNNSNTERRLETPREKGVVPQGMTSRQVLSPHDNYPKLYSDAVAGREEKKFKLTLRTKDNHTSDEIKETTEGKSKSN